LNKRKRGSGDAPASEPSGSELSVLFLCLYLFWGRHRDVTRTITCDITSTVTRDVTLGAALALAVTLHPLFRAVGLVLATAPVCG
jgi:hypothetical protein